MGACSLNKRGVSIPDNLVAFLLFSVAFIYIVSAMSGYIAQCIDGRIRGFRKDNQ